MSRYPVRWLVPLVLVAVTLAAALWVVGTRSSGSSGRAAASPGETTAQPLAADRVAASAPARSRVGVDVLRAWDRARARAYASGDTAGLHALYVAGSDAGTTDVAMLRAYKRRGLRVEGMRMQLLAVEVLAHRRDLWRLRVTDRLTGAVAVGEAGRRIDLPRDRASTRTISLRRAPDGRWRVAAVR